MVTDLHLPHRAGVKGIEVSVPAPTGSGRTETDLERCDRNLVELLQEVRVVQTGVQVLFGFLLMAPLTPSFDDLATAQRIEFFVTLVLVGLAALLLIAPTAYHRVLFRRGDKEYLVTVANRLTVLGLVAVGLSMVGAMLFVTSVLFGDIAGVAVGVVAGLLCLLLWLALPWSRRRAIRPRRG